MTQEHFPESVQILFLFFTENEEDYRITVRISLDDDCKNNICDWSITADVDWKNKHGKYEDYLGGCCHDEVAKHFPELAKFISLHLCNHYGAPMHPVENGIYHVRRSGMSVAMEYLRISEQECAELYKASEDDYRFYGLPLFKATAVKYGWDNPIGEDSGRERKYDSQY